MKKLLISCLLVLFVLVGCGKTSSEKTYTVGITDGYQLLAWRHVAEEAAKEGITLKITEFDDYTLPNLALNTGDVDLNSFQHVVFLDTEVEQHGYKISAIAKTILEPMAIYSSKISSLSELEDGARVVVPDDLSNQGRALNLLADAGLITLSTTADQIPGIKEITSNPKNLEIIEVQANAIPPYLNEVDIAVINGAVAQDAGLRIENALHKEAVDINSDNPFINIIAVRDEDKENEDILRIVELYQTDAVRDIIVEETKGATYPVW